VGFNGEVLVGRGEAFIQALTRIWDWDEEVSDDWQLLDGWRAVCVRTPADDEELAELAQAADGPVLACLVFESDSGLIRGISAAGTWTTPLGERQAKHPDAARVAVEWAARAGLLADASLVEEVLMLPWRPQVQRGFFAMLAALGIADHEFEDRPHFERPCDTFEPCRRYWCSPETSTCRAARIPPPPSRM
jgi:hypothetical protein